MAFFGMEKGPIHMTKEPHRTYLIVSSTLILLLITSFFQLTHSPCQAQSVNPRLLSAYSFLSNTSLDPIYGGHYRRMNRDGSPSMTSKHANMEGAIIRALMGYYNQIGDEMALQYAIETFNTLERHMRNPSHAYNSRMTQDWSGALIDNSRTIDNCNIIRGLVELYKQTGNDTYYQTAVNLMSFIRTYQRNGDYGGYHIEVDGSGVPNPAYYPWGYSPGFVALACGSLLSVDPANATFLDELNYALNFALTRYWDEPIGGYCYVYAPTGAIYQDNKPLHIQSVLLHGFITGYRYTANETYYTHSEDIANLVLNYWTDSGLAFLMDVNRDLSPCRSDRNSVYLAYAAEAFLEMYNSTTNITYYKGAQEAIGFISNYHYDPEYVGFYKSCDIGGALINSDKSPVYNAYILSALLGLETHLTAVPLPEPLFLFAIIGGTIIIVLVLISLIMMRRKS